MLTDIITRDFFNSPFLRDDFLDTLKSPLFNFEDAFPPINLYLSRGDNGFFLEAALTGYKKEWLDISIDGDILVVKADVPEIKDDGKAYVKRRIKATSFEKKYKVPSNYDADGAEVTYEDGLLSIFLPQKKEKETKRTLSIN